MNKLDADLQDVRERIPREHEAFINIFHLLIFSGVFTSEEIHQVFDILKAHKFTFGMPETTHPDIGNAVEHLFETIIEGGLLNPVKWDFMQGSTGEQFTEDYY